MEMPARYFAAPARFFRLPARYHLAGGRFQGYWNPAERRCQGFFFLFEAIAKFAVPLFFLTAAVSANAVPPAIT
jgi:hypothetical protein